MELVAENLVNVMAAVSIVAGLAIGAWVVMALDWVHDREEERELPEKELPGHLHEVLAGVPPALTIFFAFIAIGIVAYIIYIAVGGITY
jgi:phage shock protein PspC (stress-responsive transcriptional regulator)